MRRRESGQTTTKMKPSLGIAVSRKTDSRAIGRNIWKRRVKEVFRTRQAELFQDVACLVKVRPISAKASFSKIEEDLMRLLKKAGARV